MRFEKRLKEILGAKISGKSALAKGKGPKSGLGITLFRSLSRGARGWGKVSKEGVGKMPKNEQRARPCGALYATVRTLTSTLREMGRHCRNCA